MTLVVLIRNESTTLWLQTRQREHRPKRHGSIKRPSWAIANPDGLVELPPSLLHARRSYRRFGCRCPLEREHRGLRQELLVPVDCSKLGEHAVVVKDVPGFIKRVEAAVKAKGYEGRCGLVKYYNLETFHGSFREAESVFRKQVTQSYQREFRIVIATGSASDCPLTLEVGDLSDITIPFLAGELNGPKFLGGEVALRRSWVSFGSVSQTAGTTGSSCR